MNLGLQNKIAIVAAASQGLGKASALALAQEGATVVICSRRKKEIAEAAKDIIRETGAVVFPQTADVMKPGDIQRLVGETESVSARFIFLSTMPADRQRAIS